MWSIMQSPHEFRLRNTGREPLIFVSTLPQVEHEKSIFARYLTSEIFVHVARYLSQTSALDL